MAPRNPHQTFFRYERQERVKFYLLGAWGTATIVGRSVHAVTGAPQYTLRFADGRTLKTSEHRLYKLGGNS